MNPETIELIREAAAQAAGLFKEVSPQMWEMARMKVLAGAIIPPIAIFPFIILFAIWTFINRGNKNDYCNKEKFIIPLILTLAFFAIFVIFISCGIYEYISIDYQTLRAVRQLIIWQ